MKNPTIPINDIRDFFTDGPPYAAKDFGELADIIAPDADFASWTRFLKVVVPQYPHTFILEDLAGNQTTQWPADRSEVLRLAISDEGPWPSLHLHLPSVTVRVLIYSGWLAEIDLRRKTYDDDVYMQLGTLMHRTGDVLGVDVFLTPENALEEAFLAYDHRTRVFRKPLHGVGPPSPTHLQISSALQRVFQPLLDAPRPFQEDLVRAVADGIDALSRTHGELALQEALRSEQRLALQCARRSASHLLSQTPVATPEERSSSELTLVSHAQQALLSHTC